MFLSVVVLANNAICVIHDIFLHIEEIFRQNENSKTFTLEFKVLHGF